MTAQPHPVPHSEQAAEAAHAAFEGAYGQVAILEGWAIFDCDGSANGRWQLCRIDCQDDENAVQLESDDQAWVGVTFGTKEHHAAARQFIMRFNPPEWAAMLTFGIFGPGTASPESARCSTAAILEALLRDGVVQNTQEAAELVMTSVSSRPENVADISVATALAFVEELERHGVTPGCDHFAGTAEMQPIIEASRIANTKRTMAAVLDVERHDTASRSRAARRI